MTPANSTITSNPGVKTLEFLDGGTSAFIGFDDRFVGTLISALGREATDDRCTPNGVRASKSFYLTKRLSITHIFEG